MNSQKQTKQVGDTVGELQNTKIYDFEHCLLYTEIIDYSVVARGRIELPTHGFSVRFKPLLLNYIG